jgi:hypothetical protein
MGIFRTNNPLEFAEVDGIVIDETAPAPSVQGVGTGVAILVGQFQRGPHSLERVSSTKNIHELYGKSSALGNIQLKNKKFSALKIIRVEATGSLKASITLASSTPLNLLTLTAKSKGAYGNNIKVKVEAGSVSGKKLTIQDDNAGASEFFPTEIYDNLVMANAAERLLASKLVDANVLSVAEEPANLVLTALASGSDGALADVDYETAIAKAAVEGAGNILFLDQYNDTRNSYLKIHAGLTQDKMVICSELENDSVANNLSDVALLRDTDGRIIYASNWILTLVDGVATYTSPASWYASILSQTAPNVDPAYAGNAGLLFGVLGLKKLLTRDEYIQLMQAGVSSFEQDLDIGFKVKSGVVTQIANSSKLTVLRRRMADYLTNSIARFLKVYQNDVNSQPKRIAVKGAIQRFDKQQEDLGIVPKDSEVQGGLAKIVDIDSENSDDTIAQGKFFIVYKRRIYSSMRFIVLRAEIGESVVVTEE